MDTALYHGKFSSRGAVLTNWELKRYRGSSDEHPAVELVRQGGKFAGPLTVMTDNADLTKELSEGIYRVEKDFATLDQTHQTGHVTFVYESTAAGVRIEKQLTFHADSYIVDVALKSTGLTGSVRVGVGTNFGIVEWGEGFIGSVGPASRVDDKIEKEVPDSEVERKGAVKWGGLQDKYFMSVIIPKEGVGVVARKELYRRLILNHYKPRATTSPRSSRRRTPSSPSSAAGRTSSCSTARWKSLRAAG